MIDTLDHVILGVRDLGAATRQYALLLGRTPSWSGEHPGAGTANTLFRLENTYIELLAAVAEGPVAATLSAWLDARGEGPVGLAFGTSDAEACRQRLAERGLEPGAIEPGMGRDRDSGAFREWRRVPLPLDRTNGVLLFAIEHLSPDAVLPPAGLLCDEPASVFALDHAVVRSADPEQSKKLYGDGLGLRLALDREFPQWGARLLFFRVGGLTVEIAGSLPKPREPEADPGEPEAEELGEATVGGDRLWGLSHRVRDADAARARLVEAGFDVSDVRAGRRPETRVFTVRDGTCGVPTLVLEPPPPRSAS